MTHSSPENAGLLPCPFCGNQPSLKIMGDGVSIRCKTFFCPLEDIEIPDDTLDEAKKRWNKRPLIRAQQMREPVAWRWRPKGTISTWIYNPEPQWLAEHRDEIDAEPLYALAPAQEQIAAKWKDALDKWEDCMNRMDQMRDALGGVLGLCDLLSHRDDIPDEVKELLTNGWRRREAQSIWERSSFTSPECTYNPDLVAEIKKADAEPPEAEFSNAQEALDYLNDHAPFPRNQPQRIPSREEMAGIVYEGAHKGLKNCWKWTDDGLDAEHPGRRGYYYKIADAVLAALSLTRPDLSPAEKTEGGQS